MLILDHKAVPQEARGAVMAIGNFDGVHRGHAQVIGLARDLATDRGVPSGVLSFEPHPKQVFRPDDPPFRLTLRDAKARLIEELGIDLHVILPFDGGFSATSPDAFVQEILVSHLGIQHAVVGYDFHYGHQRKGNVETLQAAADHHGFGLTVVTEVADEGGGPLSSSAVREALQAGKAEEAAQILGRPWEAEGTIQKGDQRGRELGYPTANMVLGDQLAPAFGIYAVEMCIASSDQTNADWGPWLPGVANFGIRPMYRSAVPLMETYLFDFNQDIYGRRVRVRLIGHLRPEMSFESVEDLIKQMDRDARSARSVLENHQRQNA